MGTVLLLASACLNAADQPVVDVRHSASYAGAADRCSRYNIYEIDGARVDVVTYAHDSASGGFREFRRRTIAPIAS